MHVQEVDWGHGLDCSDTGHGQVIEFGFCECGYKHLGCGKLF